MTLKQPDLELLLQPSLDGAAGRLRQTPYSTQAQVMAAFFGGPLAALVLWAINARRLDRLTRDLVWLALAALLWVAALLLLFGHCDAAWCAALDGRAGSPRLWMRGLALAVFAGGALLHRREQAACDLTGQRRPNGTVLVIVLILAGNALQSLAEWGLQ